MTTTSDNRHTEAAEVHWVEWGTGMVSAVLVLVMIAWIGTEALLEERTPPEFKAEVTASAAVQGGHRVEFDIANQATSTAAAVVVRGEILEAGQVLEGAEVTFDYVPAQSKSSGAILFSQDPAGREVRIRAVGYTDP